MNKQDWDTFYNERRISRRYPTEWVTRTIAGGNYPNLSLDKSRYPGSRILDLGCGDGRNIELLSEMGFEIFGTEISHEIANGVNAYLKKYQIPATIRIGANHDLPFEDSYFDYILACASLYYLDEGIQWVNVLAEISRVLKKGGLLFCNFPDSENAVLRDAQACSDGSYLITSDPFHLRNGVRFMAADHPNDISRLMGTNFRVIGSGIQSDDYFGLRVSGIFAVLQRL